MTIKTEVDLTAQFPDNQARSITESDLRDFVDSVMAVGGTMLVNDTDFDITTAWQPFNIFDTSIDTKGLVEDFPNGQFTLQAGAGGVYSVDCIFGIASIFAGWVEIGLTKNGSLTPYKAKRSLTAGGSGVAGVLGTGNLADGDTVGLAIRGSGNATVQIESCQFRATRI